MSLNSHELVSRYGSRKRENGVLSNHGMSASSLTTASHFIKDPTNGRRQARRNDRSNWMTAEIPELAIIDRELWEAAQARRRARLWQRRGPKGLLSGLLKCGVCGASYIIVTKDHPIGISGPVGTSAHDANGGKLSSECSQC